MPKTLNRRPSVKRWWKLWLPKPKNPLWKSLPRNCTNLIFLLYNYISIAFKKTLASKSPRNAARFSPFKTSSSKNSSSSKNLSSILPSSWSSTLRNQNKRKKKRLGKKRKKNPRIFWPRLEANENYEVKRPYILNEFISLSLF